MDKIMAYVNSIDPSAFSYVDKDVFLAFAEHHCLRGEKRISEVFKSLPSKTSVFISGEEVKAVNSAVRFSKENGPGFGVIDLADSGLIPSWKFCLNSWKTPVITFGGRSIIERARMLRGLMLLKRKSEIK